MNAKSRGGVDERLRAVHVLLPAAGGVRELRERAQGDPGPDPAGAGHQPLPRRDQGLLGAVPRLQAAHRLLLLHRELPRQVPPQGKTCLTYLQFFNPDAKLLIPIQEIRSLIRVVCSQVGDQDENVEDLFMENILLSEFLNDSHCISKDNLEVLLKNGAINTFYLMELILNKI